MMKNKIKNIKDDKNEKIKKLIYINYYLFKKNIHIL